MGLEISQLLKIDLLLLLTTVNSNKYTVLFYLLSTSEEFASIVKSSL